MRPMATKRNPMIELLGIAGFIAVWFLLQAWVLPRLGVPT
jgi:hypothetical protein